MPKVAKPVSIPTVPTVGTAGNGQTESQDLAEVTSLVSSVVIESENNIVLDFSTKSEEQEDVTPGTGRSETSSSSLLSKVIKVIRNMTVTCQLELSLTLPRNVRLPLWRGKNPWRARTLSSPLWLTTRLLRELPHGIQLQIKMNDREESPRLNLEGPNDEYRELNIILAGAPCKV